MQGFPPTTLLHNQQQPQQTRSNSSGSGASQLHHLCWGHNHSQGKGSTVGRQGSTAQGDHSQGKGSTVEGGKVYCQHQLQ